MSITKRLLSAILTLCMIVMMVPAVAVNAAEGAVFTVGTAKVEEGETSVSVDVSLDQNPGFSEAYLSIGYDAEHFTPVSYVFAGTAFNEAVDNEGKEDGTIDLVLQCGYTSKRVFYNEDSTYTGNIVTINFGVADGTPAGEYPLTVSCLGYADFDDWELVPVQDPVVYGADEDSLPTIETAATINSGKIVVEACPYEGLTLVLKADKTEVEVGDTVTVNAVLYNIPETGITQYQFYLNFNRRALSLDAIAIDSAIEGKTNYSTSSTVTGLAGGTFGTEKIYGPKATLATFTFTVKASAANGEYTIDEIIDVEKTSFAYNDGTSHEYARSVTAPATVTVINSDAIDYDTFTLETRASETALEPGDEFTVTSKLCVLPANGIGGFQYHIDFDAETFELTKVEIPATIEGKTNYGTSNLGGLVCGTLQLANFFEDAVLATATFKVKDTAKNGTYTIGYNTNTQGDTFYYQDVETQTNVDVTFPADAYATLNITGGVEQKVTISFVDGENTLSTDEYDIGDTVVVPADPTKEATASTVYTFAGWSDGKTTYAPDAIPAAGANTTYTAVYTEATRTYTVTWVVGENSANSTVAYGDTPDWHGVISTAKAADEAATYTFAGWIVEEDDEPITVLPAVTGDITYIAAYTATTKTYTVTWNVDGITSTEEYPYGETPEFKGATEKASTKRYYYDLEGWTVAGVTYYYYSDSSTGFVVEDGVNEDGDTVYKEAAFPTVGSNMTIVAAYGEYPIVDIFGTGMENWSNNTQILVAPTWQHGETEDVAKAYTYELTIDGETYIFPVSTTYWQTSWAIMRFQPCVDETNPWVPETDAEYTVEVAIKNGDELVYEGTIVICLEDVEPIVPAEFDPDGGKIVDGLNWYYDGDKTLTIYGSSAAVTLPGDYTYVSGPWKDYVTNIKVVKFEGFMTKIPGKILNDAPNIEKIFVNEGVTEIGGDAFCNIGSLKEVYYPSTLKNIAQGVTWCCWNIDAIYYAGTEEMFEDVSYGGYNCGINEDPKNTVVYNTVKDSGTGAGYTWTVYDNGLAIFEGEGATEMSGDASAWTSLGVKEAYFFGFKSILGGCFSSSGTLTKAFVSEGTENIGGDAFAYNGTLATVVLPASATLSQGVLYASGNITTVIYSGCPKELTAALTKNNYNDGALTNGATLLCLTDDPTWEIIPMGKYGSGFENNGGKTTLMITSNFTGAFATLWDARADYVWNVTIDGKTYTGWTPVSNYKFNDNNLIMRFCVMEYEDFFIPAPNTAYHVEKLELVKDGVIVYKATSTDTWNAGTLDLIYPEGGYKLGLDKYGSGMENWSNETQILTTLAHDKISTKSIYQNKNDYVWEITVDGTSYKYRPSSEYFFDNYSGIVRFEPCVNSTFVPVVNQEYTVSVKIYKADGTTLCYYTDEVSGFKITVDPIVHETPKLTLGKFGSGMENWNGATQILTTLTSDNTDVEAMFNNKDNYVWELVIDGEAYRFAPSTFYGGINICRFEPVLYSAFVPVKGRAYSIQVNIYDLDGTTKLFTTDTVDGFVINVAPLLKEPVKLNLDKYGNGMENWGTPRTVQMLPQLGSDTVNITTLWNNRADYVWELTIDDTPYRFAPSTNMGWNDTKHIIRFEPVLNTPFIPVVDQEYSVSVKIFDISGTILQYYTDTEAGYKITEAPVLPTYTITWIVDGEPTTTDVVKGQTPVFDGTPVKADDDEFTYTFTGWDPEVVPAFGEATYTAQFEATPKVPEVKNGWYNEGGNDYYYINDVAVTGFRSIDGKLYFFNEEGICSDKDGYTGLNGIKYYSEGTLLKSAWIENDTKYVNANSEIVKSKTTTIGGKLYTFDEDGIATGYNGVYGGKYYVDGVVSDSFTGEFDGKYYVNGVLAVKVWVADNTKYVNADSELVKSKTTTIGGTLYTFDEEGIATVYNGFYGSKYYVDGVATVKAWTDGVGSQYVNANSELVKSKTTTIDGVLYTFDEDGYATAFTGIYGGKYYDEGVISTSFTGELDGKYYVNGAVVVRTWVEDNTKYVNANSELVKSKTTTIDGVLYTFGEDGYATAFTGIYGGKYYAEGVIFTSFTGEFGGKYYVNGAVVVRTWVEDNTKYVNANGELVKEKITTIGGTLYTFDADGIAAVYTGSYGTKYYVDGVESDSFTGELNGKAYKDGVVVKRTWVQIGADWYYANANGVFVKGKTTTIGGVSYTFDASGKADKAPVIA